MNNLRDQYGLATEENSPFSPNTPDQVFARVYEGESDWESEDMLSDSPPQETVDTVEFGESGESVGPDDAVSKCDPCYKRNWCMVVRKTRHLCDGPFKEGCTQVGVA